VSKLKKKFWYHYPREMKSKPDLFDATYAVLKRDGRVLAKFDGVYTVELRRETLHRLLYQRAARL